jgi:hypothetical protein
VSTEDRGVLLSLTQQADRALAALNESGADPELRASLCQSIADASRALWSSVETGPDESVTGPRGPKEIA